MIAIVIGAIFVSRHEAQLAAEAERALPGPLEVGLRRIFGCFSALHA